ncbi:MAG: hypothetical protein J0H39_13405 [Alphaproteobacteria bacterium]|nr:hypothetical protein [Alphaproteobacteria bacterium]
MSKMTVFPHRRVRLDDPEPAIADLLDDPVTHAVMRRDGVTRQTILRTVEAARARLGLGFADRVGAGLCCAA